MESARDEIFCEMPVVRLVPVPEEDMEGKETFSCPMFQGRKEGRKGSFVVEPEEKAGPG